jgi:hypothetical protein
MGSCFISDRISLGVGRFVSAENTLVQKLKTPCILRLDSHVDNFIPQNLFVTGNDKQWRKTTEIGQRWANQGVCHKTILNVEMNLLIDCQCFASPCYEGYRFVTWRA